MDRLGPDPGIWKSMVLLRFETSSLVDPCVSQGRWKGMALEKYWLWLEGEGGVVYCTNACKQRKTTK